MYNPFLDIDGTVTDEELVSRAQAGERDALEQLLMRHQPWIFNIAIRMLGRRADAEDATQDVLLRVLKSLRTFRGGIPLFDSYEILSPKAQTSGNTAVLTYQLAQRSGSTARYWNATQVYVKKAEGWRVIHTHWSAAKERQP